MLHMLWLPFLSPGPSFQGTLSCHALPRFVLIKMTEKTVKLAQNWLNVLNVNVLLFVLHL